ncbi:EAL domain-containing protein (putative c-di-GMP-specific phosphodiesterase class I) [Microbacteriaceae bacterium SG_E_30_P1]|uniref:EAL domain-containing protein (Putative c-di-GMP-specific phosphodiesterase class I) n=1 Tax=Antiquaquibacter oligotrophicus TaxID=2880260 RepID=A0ABT6KJT6_9MICO|nr:EAL domain-containing protein [Antiquaquibacter oligotrophicus]MDH6180200.1 EAL domain-containing protein (putative c-di-GMP-specific phosphodiesterase class I) [Antiquaquibacter oligotrophicus]UDF14052.1 EAL domain-containing protein [Antiquaquibacter oligotrophicus]
MFLSPQALAAELDAAVDQRQLVTYYQPQIDLSSGDIVAVEALVRWIHPTYGVIPPDEFIPIAESIGSIRRVGRTVLTDAAQQLTRWSAAGKRLELSVNISPTELGPELAGELVETLDEFGMDPTLLTMEITETEPIIDLPRAVRCLHEVRALGVGVSVDDFGTGYASINQLRNLPATELKVDQSLIRGNRSAARRTLIPVLAEASDLGIRIVAEGVETADQMNHAIELGCQRAQGYLIGAPMTPDEFNAHFS